MTIAVEKCETMLFTKWTKEKHTEVPIYLDNTTIKTVKYATFLGITLDSGLSFAEHVRRTRVKTNTRCRPLQALSGRDWGSDETLLRSVYTTYIPSTLTYAGEELG